MSFNIIRFSKTLLRLNNLWLFHSQNNLIDHTSSHSLLPILTLTCSQPWLYLLVRQFCRVTVSLIRQIGWTFLFVFYCLMTGSGVERRAAVKFQFDQVWQKCCPPRHETVFPLLRQQRAAQDKSMQTDGQGSHWQKWHVHAVEMKQAQSRRSFRYFTEQPHQATRVTLRLNYNQHTRHYQSTHTEQRFCRSSPHERWLVAKAP